jgi:hypothetical protein
VAFDGNGYATKERVYYFWIYRCAELTLQQGYSLYVVRPYETGHECRSVFLSMLQAPARPVR